MRFRRFYESLACVVVALISISCSDLNVDNPAPLYVSVSTEKTDYNAGSVAELSVKANSLSGNKCTTLRLNSFDEERGNVSILDSTLSVPTGKMDCKVAYRMPYVSTDSLALRITAEVADDGGHYQQASTSVRIISADRYLREQSGITLYAVEGENRPNGFSFQRGLPIRTSLSDSADIDVFVAYDSSDDSKVLLRRWNTNTKRYFVRANGYNYAKATYQTVRSVYKASVPYHVVDNIQNDDIIIVGDEIEPIAVFKVVAVFDEQGVANDRFVVSMKLVE